MHNTHYKTYRYQYSAYSRNRKNNEKTKIKQILAQGLKFNAVL